MAENKTSYFARYVPARYVFAVLGSIAFMIIYGLKVNLSVAIVAMVNHSAIMSEEAVSEGHNNLEERKSSACVPPSNSTEHKEDGPFLWPSTLQGAILSSYFWGYIIAQYPGGFLAENASAKWVMFFSVAINVVCTLLTPFMARLHYATMLLMRVGEGLGGGVTFPAMHVMLAHWAPVNERSIMSSIVYAGTSLGTVISMFLSGVIASKFGWQYVFYIQGGLAAIWLIGWMFLIAEDPQRQTLISQEERDYIVNSLGDHEGKPKMKTPWKSVLRSAPFWAILVTHTCSNWGWYMVLIELPLYLKLALGFNLSENAVVTATPFLLLWLFCLALGKTLDILREKNKITTTFARKCATLICTAGPGICLIVLCFIGCNRTLAVIMMTIAVICNGGMFCGFLSNHIDIAPNYAGSLMAITNTVATIPGILVPLFVGKLVAVDPGIDSWRIIFLVTIILYFIGGTIFTLLGSGEPQAWNNPEGNNIAEAQPLKSPTSISTAGKSDYDSTKTSTLDT